MRLVRRDERELGEPVVAVDLLRRQAGRGRVEVALGRDLRAEVGGIEEGDPPGRGPPGGEQLPERRPVGAAGGDHADPGDHGTARAGHRRASAGQRLGVDVAQLRARRQRAELEDEERRRVSPSLHQPVPHPDRDEHALVRPQRPLLVRRAARDRRPATQNRNSSEYGCQCSVTTSPGSSRSVPRKPGRGADGGGRQDRADVTAAAPVGGHVVDRYDLDGEAVWLPSCVMVLPRSVVGGRTAVATVAAGGEPLDLARG